MSWEPTPGFRWRAGNLIEPPRILQQLWKYVGNWIEGVGGPVALDVRWKWQDVPFDETAKEPWNEGDVDPKDPLKGLRP